MERSKTTISCSVRRRKALRRRVQSNHSLNRTREAVSLPRRLAQTLGKTIKMKEKFEDNGTSFYDFTSEVLVECPRCKGKAEVKKGNLDTKDYATEFRVTCSNCGFSKIKKTKIYSISIDSDGFFEYPVWLKSNCCGKVLYALNYKHLEFIENYVLAKIRTRSIKECTNGFYFRNKTLASRLPKWIKDRKNRKAILKVIHKLKEE